MNSRFYDWNTNSIIPTRCLRKKSNFHFWHGKHINTMVSSIFIIKSSQNRWPSRHLRVQNSRFIHRQRSTKLEDDAPSSPLAAVTWPYLGCFVAPDWQFPSEKDDPNDFSGLLKFGVADYQINSNMPLVLHLFVSEFSGEVIL